MGCHFLLQGIFLTWGLNLGLLHCRQIPYHQSHRGSPEIPVTTTQLSLGIWGRMDTHICMAESLCCSPETITILLIPQQQIKSLRKKKNKTVKATLDSMNEWVWLCCNKTLFTNLGSGLDSTHGLSFANPCSRKENQKVVSGLRKQKKAYSRVSQICRCEG